MRANIAHMCMTLPCITYIVFINEVGNTTNLTFVRIQLISSWVTAGLLFTMSCLNNTIHILQRHMAVAINLLGRHLHATRGQCGSTNH